MQRQLIPVRDLVLRPFGFWSDDWALLASGDFAARRFNSMAVAWGALGHMWGQPLAMVVVRPQRYTRQFMDQFDSFTLSIFPRDQQPKLQRLGNHSGREIDKINDSGFTPIASSQVASPGFDEAEVIIECRKSYFDDFDPQHFLADYIAPNYAGDYHRMYFGQVLAAWGTAAYCEPSSRPQDAP
jgi:flavin reductase (DIM6/NTAB) family NADH-FMN oxidoreductase RutF